MTFLLLLNLADLLVIFFSTALGDVRKVSTSAGNDIKTPWKSYSCHIHGTILYLPTFII